MFPLKSFYETMEKSCSVYSQTRDELYSNALNMSPKIPQKSKLFLMTPDAILNLSGVVEFGRIVYLNLHGHCLRKVENLGECVNLKVLILSFNEINKMEGFGNLVRLER